MPNEPSQIDILVLITDPGMPPYAPSGLDAHITPPGNFGAKELFSSSLISRIAETASRST
jgi:hypothetical protein